MSYEHLVAGVLGGLTSTAVLHPLDLLKVRFAVADGRSTIKKNYKNISDAISIIVKEEGIKGLYKGVTPNCLGAGTSWGLYFLFYNAVKKRMAESSSQTHLGPLKHMAAGACAGALTTAITNPIWVVKTRLCLQYGDVSVAAATSTIASNFQQSPASANHSLSENRRYSGTWDAFKKVYKFEGVSGLYKGFVPGLLNVSHGAIQLALYEELKKTYLIRNNLPSDHNMTTIQYLSCAALSKLLAASITYPYQVVRARLQDQHVDYEGVIDVIKKTWSYKGFNITLTNQNTSQRLLIADEPINTKITRNEGYRGFYKGLGPSLLRVVPASAITFVIYENTLAYLTDSQGVKP